MSRIVVGMSGGVDSAVSALLLREQGYEVLGVFMKNWQEEDDNGVCTAEDDYDYVRAVCDQIGIPYFSVNFTREYWDRVFTLFLEAYKKGRTPNPDVLCNKEIKFDAFLQFAMQMDADCMATGHYAQIREDADGVHLLRGADSGKDQTYFLHMLNQSQLSKAMFPIGHLQKKQVREIAAQAGLANAARKDSTGICFIGERNFRAFLKQYLPAQPGDIVDSAGNVLARHDGLMYYTLGQRKGLGIGGRKESTGEAWFVIEKQLDTNRLIVAQGDDTKLYSDWCKAETVNFILGEAPSGEFACTVKTRYREADIPAVVTVVGDKAYVKFLRPVRAVTPGQSVVFYREEECLGGAIICESGKHEH